MATETVQTAPVTGSVIPAKVAQKVGFFPINDVIKNFMNFSLYEIVKNNSGTRFLSNAQKFCYRLDYKTLALSYAEARDNYGDSIVAAHSDAYVKQQMHSISGEQGDLCYYGYSPDHMREFLVQNTHLHYTFMPLTVHAVDSANGVRHDMLLIFDNRTKFVYWFDGRNREDYLSLGQHLPKNVIDVMFINMFGNLKLGYSYEPAPSWQIQGTVHSYGSIGMLDFALSTAWCYNMLLSLDEYDNPTGYLSILDTLSEADRFHLLYCSMLSVIGAAKYHPVVPKTAQIDLMADTVRTADTEPNKHVQSSVIPHVQSAVIGSQEVKAAIENERTVPRTSQAKVEVQACIANLRQRHQQQQTGDFVRMNTDSSLPGQVNHTEVHLRPVTTQPMPIVSSMDRAAKDHESCVSM